MTDKKDLERIADLAGNEPLAHAPAAAPLTPDVRSGATFPFKGSGLAVDSVPPFVVIWVYSVVDRPAFVAAVADYEGSFRDDPPTVKSGLVYRGTYSVSISSAAPEFEYRTIWSLDSLANLQTLNDVIADTANTKFQAILKCMQLRPPMRAEIMGLTKSTRIGVH
jgi:hypothetical protein